MKMLDGQEKEGQGKKLKRIQTTWAEDKRRD
jgi:hypothetical protein